MNINAKPGQRTKLELTKRERDTLHRAADILELLATHGTDRVKENAAGAKEGIIETLLAVDEKPSDKPPY